MFRATREMLIGTQVYRQGDELPALPDKEMARLVRKGHAVAVPDAAGCDTADAPPAVETAERRADSRKRRAG